MRLSEPISRCYFSYRTNWRVSLGSWRVSLELRQLCQQTSQWKGTRATLQSRYTIWWSSAPGEAHDGRIHVRPTGWGQHFLNEIKKRVCRFHPRFIVIQTNRTCGIVQLLKVRLAQILKLTETFTSVYGSNRQTTCPSNLQTGKDEDPPRQGHSPTHVGVRQRKLSALLRVETLSTEKVWRYQIVFFENLDNSVFPNGLRVKILKFLALNRYR